MNKTIQYARGSLLSLSVVLAGCGDKEENKDQNKGNPSGASLSGQQVANVTANFSGAVGVLVVDSAAVTGLKLKGAKNLSLTADTPSGTSSSDGSLVKVGEDGEVKSALSSSTSGESNGPQMEIPKVQTIAVSPSKEIYLHFERAFVYKTPENPADWQKVHDMANGYQCQIFKVLGGNIDELRAGTPPADVSNLECLDNQHFVNSWLAQRNSVFQFDSASNVYYPGSLPTGGGKMVVYKYDVTTKTTSEVINSNICVQDFLVTKAGGVFYTGTSSCSGGGGEGGFFRYVSPTSELREIANGWWNFVFEPVEGATTDQAVFFGPDPRSATTASLNSACLFNFNPAAGSTAALSISEKITCGADINSWINMSRPADIATFGAYNTGSSALPTAWVDEYKSRCTSEGQVFAGGGSQISAIKQDTAGEVYVIGKIRKKKGGELSCALSVKGAHCVVNGAPYLPGHTLYGTAALCQATGGVWTTDEGFCDGGSFTTRDTCLATASTRTWRYREVQYNNIVSEYCGESSANSAFIASSALWNTTVSETEAASAGPATAYAATKFSRGWMNCQIKGSTSSNGGDWTDEYKGLGKVNSTTKTLELLSGTDEQAIGLWLVGAIPYYSARNTSGKYYLKRWDVATQTAIPVAENFEAYNISYSNEADKLFYDGLDFATNSYSFGTMTIASPYTRTIKTGLTGTVKTIVILPR